MYIIENFDDYLHIWCIVVYYLWASHYFQLKLFDSNSEDNINSTQLYYWILSIDIKHIDASF